MRMRCYLFALFLCTSYSTNSLAYYIDGTKLHTGAIEYQKYELGQVFDSFDVGTYFGFIAGVTESTFNTGLYCPPNNIENEQNYAIVANYLKKHPEKWTQPAVIIVLQAMKEAFPCPK